MGSGIWGCEGRSFYSLPRDPGADGSGADRRGQSSWIRPNAQQMGHSSIQITVDTYGHLIPGADIAWVDRLDSKTPPHQNAPEAHQVGNEAVAESAQVVEKIWLPPRDSNPDMLIQSQLSYH